MRYFFEPMEFSPGMYGQTYFCDHPVYNSCTLYKIPGMQKNGKIVKLTDPDIPGLAVIQQRYNPLTKRTWWEEIDKELRDPIYLNPRFIDYFRKHAGVMDENKLFPTVTVRQLMWALRMKPIPKQKWETVFDHTDI